MDYKLVEFCLDELILPDTLKSGTATMASDISEIKLFLFYYLSFLFGQKFIMTIKKSCYIVGAEFSYGLDIPIPSDHNLSTSDAERIPDFD